MLTTLKRSRHIPFTIASLVILATGVMLYALPARGGSPSPKPRQEAPQTAEKIMLFTGKEEDLQTHWVRRGTEQPAAWKISDSAMVVKGGDIATKQNFGDMQLHIEFRVPL